MGRIASLAEPLDSFADMAELAALAQPLDAFRDMADLSSLAQPLDFSYRQQLMELGTLSSFDKTLVGSYAEPLAPAVDRNWQIQEQEFASVAEPFTAMPLQRVYRRLEPLAPQLDGSWKQYTDVSTLATSFQKDWMQYGEPLAPAVDRNWQAGYRDFVPVAEPLSSGIQQFTIFSSVAEPVAQPDFISSSEVEILEPLAIPLDYTWSRQYQQLRLDNGYIIQRHEPYQRLIELAPAVGRDWQASYRDLAPLAEPFVSVSFKEYAQLEFEPLAVPAMRDSEFLLTEELSYTYPEVMPEYSLQEETKLRITPAAVPVPVFAPVSDPFYFQKAAVASRSLVESQPLILPYVPQPQLEPGFSEISSPSPVKVVGFDNITEEEGLLRFLNQSDRKRTAIITVLESRGINARKVRVLDTWRKSYDTFNDLSQRATIMAEQRGELDLAILGSLELAKQELDKQTRKVMQIAPQQGEIIVEHFINQVLPEPVNLESIEPYASPGLTEPIMPWGADTTTMPYPVTIPQPTFMPLSRVPDGQNSLIGSFMRGLREAFVSSSAYAAKIEQSDKTNSHTYAFQMIRLRAMMKSAGQHAGNI